VRLSGLHQAPALPAHRSLAAYGALEEERQEAMSQYKDYLGDSVYADYDGFAIILTTENGAEPSNTIVLEPEVLQALNRYAERIKTLLRAQANQLKS
jgi:hypothetical protein